MSEQQELLFGAYAALSHPHEHSEQDLLCLIRDLAAVVSRHQPPPQPPACAAAEELPREGQIRQVGYEFETYIEGEWRRVLPASAFVELYQLRDKVAARDQTIQRLREALIEGRWCVRMWAMPRSERIQKWLDDTDALTDTTPTDKGEK